MKLELNALNESQKQVVLLPSQKHLLAVAGPGFLVRHERLHTVLHIWA